MFIFTSMLCRCCFQGFLGEKEDFLLFASLFEVTMMDPSVGTRPMTFELSIGEKSVFFVLDRICVVTQEVLFLGDSHFKTIPNGTVNINASPDTTRQCVSQSLRS